MRLDATTLYPVITIEAETVSARFVLGTALFFLQSLVLPSEPNGQRLVARLRKNRTGASSTSTYVLPRTGNRPTFSTKSEFRSAKKKLLSVKNVPKR